LPLGFFIDGADAVALGEEGFDEFAADEAAGAGYEDGVGLHGGWSFKVFEGILKSGKGGGLSHCGHGEHGGFWKNEEIGLFAVVVVALWEREFSGRWSTGGVGRIGRIRRGGGGFRIRGGPWR
jgi:hypothetical protein